MTKNPPGWTASVSSLPKGTSGAKGGEIADGFALAREAYGRLCLRQGSGLLSFAYLYRRFGPPVHGCDEYKELASYVIATPKAGVWLTVGPSASPLAYAVGYFVSPDVLSACRRPYAAWERAFRRWYASGNFTQTADAFMEARMNSEVTASAKKVIGPYPPLAKTWKLRGWKKGPPPLRATNRALLACLMELLRPVSIRDVMINILGRL